MIVLAGSTTWYSFGFLTGETEEPQIKKLQTAKLLSFLGATFGWKQTLGELLGISFMKFYSCSTRLSNPESQNHGIIKVEKISKII